MTRDEWLEQVAEDRAAQRADRPAQPPDPAGRDQDWHCPRDLAPQGPW